jgi:potassium-dependent mechanosensitive channel
MFELLFRSWLAATCLWLAGLFPAVAQTNAASTNAPAATKPIALSDVVKQAQDTAAQLKENLGQISPDLTAESVRAGLPDLTRRVDERIEVDKHSEQANPSLGSLQNAQTAWQTISGALDDAQDDLSTRVGEQNTLLGNLDNMETSWQATLTSAKGTNSPVIVQSIQQVIAQIAETKKALLDDLNQLYPLQKQVALQADRAKAGLDAVNKAITTAQLQLFQQTHPKLWNPESFSTQGVGVVGREKQTLEEQIDGVKTYLGDRVGAMLIHAILFGLLIAAFFWVRNVTREHAKTEEGLRDAERIFNAPLVTALLLALIACNWLYPQDEAPRLLWSFIGAIALVPTVIIVRRLISPDLHLLLYATVAAYFIDQVRYAATPAGVFARVVFLAELLAASIFILATLRSKQLCVSSSNPGQVEKVVRAYLHAAFFVFLAAGFANVFGYVPLSFVIGNGMLESSYLAVVFYAGVRILDALALAALSLRPISGFAMVRRHHDLVYAKTATILRWIATGVWAVAALQEFYLRDPLWQKASDELSKTHSFGSLQFQLGAILAFPLTVWAAFALSSLVRFALEEDVYPALNLPRGIPYAISTMVHYTILVIGFFMALSAMGINLSNYAVLAGAFGVGLGFGLQNIMNNFISGLILLFERPVKVGDTIQIDANTIGRVERIGIRASVILLTNGSELILPNGNLISNPVTNWTLSNCERLIEVPVNIGPKSDTRHAIQVLVDVAKAHSAVLKNPAPQAIIVTIAAASTSLKLRCWLDAEEDWIKVTSEVTLAVQAGFEKENIPLA